MKVTFSKSPSFLVAPVRERGLKYIEFVAVTA